MPNADINAPQSSNPGLAPFLDDAPTPAYIRSLIAQGIQISEVDHDKAVVLLRKACSLAELCRDEDGLIDALIALAWCFQSHGQPAQALSLASRALVHAEHNNNMQGWRNARYIIATAQTNAGNHLEAERILRELIDHAQSLGLRTHEADYRVELGLLYRNISRFGESLELCKTAHEIFVAEADPHIALSHNNLAIAYAHNNMPEMATQHALAALNSCAPERHALRASYLHTVGFCHLQAGRFNDAAQCLLEAKALSIGQPDTSNTCELHLSLARIYLRQGNTSAAIDTAERAVAISQRLHLTMLEGAAHRVLSDAYRCIGAFDLASEHNNARQSAVAKSHARTGETLMAIMRAEQQVKALMPIWLNDLYRSA